LGFSVAVVAAVAGFVWVWVWLSPPTPNLPGNCPLRSSLLLIQQHQRGCVCHDRGRDRDCQSDCLARNPRLLPPRRIGVSLLRCTASVES
jgi:hypothetical protein